PAALDDPRELHLALAREQADRAHPVEIGLDRLVRRSLHLLLPLLRLVVVVAPGRAIDQRDALALRAAEHRLDGALVDRAPCEEVGDRVVLDEAALASVREESFDRHVVVVFVRVERAAVFQRRLASCSREGRSRDPRAWTGNAISVLHRSEAL